MPIVYLMEATGVYYENLAWFLHHLNCHVTVILPKKSKHYFKSLGLKSKNDKIDARGLADVQWNAILSKIALSNNPQPNSSITYWYNSLIYTSDAINTVLLL